MSDVKVTIPRDDYNPNQRTDIDVEVVNPDGTVSTRTVKGAVQATTQEDGSVSFGILASAHVPFAAGSSAYATAVLADTPIAYWRLGQASGAAIDSSGNGYNSDDSTNTPTTGVTGLLAGDSDTACDFDAASSEDYGWSDAAWMDTIDSATVEAWVKPSTIQTTAVVRYIVSRWNATEGRHFRLETFYDAGSVYFRCYMRVGSTNIRMDSTTTVSAGSTYHLAATYDASTGNYALYVNGSAEATGTHAGGGVLADGFTALRMGCVADLGSNSQFWDGVIDEVALYTTALSSTRVAAHYAAGT